MLEVEEEWEGEEVVVDVVAVACAQSEEGVRGRGG